MLRPALQGKAADATDGVAEACSADAPEAITLGQGILAPLAGRRVATRFAPPPARSFLFHISPKQTPDDGSTDGMGTFVWPRTSNVSRRGQPLRAK
jgi:hypothetical protein